MNRPAVSVVLIHRSLGTRVLLAYTLSALPALGVNGIWIAIPIGWFLADAHRDFALAAGGQKRQDPITHPTKKTSLEASFQGGFCSVRNGVTDSHFPQSA